MSIVNLVERRVNVREAGESGPLVVLIHGSLSHSGRWNDAFEACADSYRLIALDLPGYGRSDAIDDPATPIFVEDMRAVCAILDAEGEAAHLVGANYGAGIAARAALARPQQVLSLTLIEPFAFHLLEEAEQVDWLEAGALGYQVLAACELGERARPARRVFDFIYGDGAFNAAPEEIQTYVTYMSERLAADWRALALDAPGQLRSTDFARVQAPIQVLVHEQTRDCVRAASALLARVAANGEIEVLASSDAFAGALRRALDARREDERPTERAADEAGEAVAPNSARRSAGARGWPSRSEAG